MWVSVLCSFSQSAQTTLLSSIQRTHDTEAIAVVVPRPSKHLKKVCVHGSSHTCTRFSSFCSPISAQEFSSTDSLWQFHKKATNSLSSASTRQDPTLWPPLQLPPSCSATSAVEWHPTINYQHTNFNTCKPSRIKIQKSPPQQSHHCNTIQSRPVSELFSDDAAYLYSLGAPQNDRQTSYTAF